MAQATTPELQKPLPVKRGAAPGPAGLAGQAARSARGASLVKHGPNTAGFCCPFFSTTGGWSERSLLTPKLTVWMSFDDRFSKTTVSPGRAESVFGK